jgi:hypothetical protein
MTTVPQNDGESQQRKWEGAGTEEYRDDLDFSLGIILPAPLHGLDINGNVVFGIRPQFGMADEAITNQFAREMRNLIVTGMQPLVDRGTLPANVLEPLEARPYSFPPAAQSWPLYLFNLWHDARPFLEDGALLLAWGAAIREVLRKVNDWVQARQSERNWDVVPSGQETEIQVNPILTRPAIVALCYLDLVERHKVTGAVTMEAHGRGFAVATGPGHPGAFDQYLVRIQTNGPAYFWLVRGDGTTLDHFSLDGTDIAVLPLPNFSTGEPDEFRIAQPLYRGSIQG